MVMLYASNCKKSFYNIYNISRFHIFEYQQFHGHKPIYNNMLVSEPLASTGDKDNSMLLVTVPALFIPIREITAPLFIILSLAIYFELNYRPHNTL